jgi:2,4-diketo-3-deoxy-L-fuconate hydrolase
MIEKAVIRDARYPIATGAGSDAVHRNPVYSYAVTALVEIADVHNLRLWLKVNGETMQDGATANFIFNVPHVVSYVSQFMTLLPGDVISTGTPAGVGLGLKPPRYLKPGDIVELGIDGLGEQRQCAVAHSA